MTQVWDFLHWTDLYWVMWVNVPVDDLELSARASNAMRMDGIETLGQLCGRTAAEILRIPNCGKATLAEIENVLADRNLALAPIVNQWVHDLGKRHGQTNSETD